MDLVIQTYSNHHSFSELWFGLSNSYQRNFAFTLKICFQRLQRLQQTSFLCLYIDILDPTYDCRLHKVV